MELAPTEYVNSNKILQGGKRYSFIFSSMRTRIGDSRENISALTEKQVPHSIVGSVDRFSVVHLASSVVPLASVSRAATSPTTAFFFFSSSGFHVLFSAGSALVSTVGRVTFSNASTSNYDR